MNIIRLLIIVLAFGLFVSSISSDTEAQFSPSERLTEGFHQNINSFIANSGGAFVSGCQNKKGDETAILMFPFGENEGSLSLFRDRKVYNGAGVARNGDRIIATEGGGGEWSHRKLQFFVTTLAAMNFRLLLGDQLRGVEKSKFTNVCPAFVDQR